MTIVQIIAFALACLLIGLSKGGLGGPLPVSLVVPMLALVIDAKTAVALVVPFLIVADWFALRLYWRKWDVAQIRLMLPAAVIGVIMGGFLLSVISPNLLKIIIAVMTIIVLIYKIWSDRSPNLTYVAQPWHGYLSGWSTGLASTLANTGAPTFTIYLLMQQLNPVTFIGTTTLFFTFVNLMKVPIFIQQGLINFDLLSQVVWAFPLVPVGVWIGHQSVNRINARLFEQIMMVLLVVSTTLLITTISF